MNASRPDFCIAMYRCTNDLYTRDTDTFETVEDFQAMCLACFDERASLRASGDDFVQDGGDYDGQIVLERVGGEG